MAKDSNREVAWATFILPTRLSAQSHAVSAVARSASVKLTKVDVDGIPHLRIEDKAIAFPGDIPWTAIGSVGWAER